MLLASYRCHVRVNTLTTNTFPVNTASVSKVDIQIMNRLYKNPFYQTRGVSRIQPNIYGGDFLRKQLMSFSRYLLKKLHLRY